MKISGRNKFLYLSFLFLMLEGCIYYTVPSATTYAPVTASATPTPCPQVLLLPIPFTLTPIPPSTSTHFFVLVDISGSYSSYYVSSLSLINDSLGRLLKPGDQLTIALIGAKSGQPTEKIFDEISPLTEIHPVFTEDIPPTPVFPSAIEIPTKYKGTTMDEIEQKQTEEAITKLNQDNLNSYNCKVLEWNREIQNRKQFETPQPNTGYTEFLKHASSALYTARNISSQGSTDIYSALWDVSETFSVDKATGQFQKFVLIVFSDLDGNLYFPNVKNNIDLSQTNVIIANYPCDKPNICQTNMRFWINEFTSQFEAQTIAILRPEDTEIQSIINLSRR